MTVAFRWAAPGPSVGAVRVSQGVPRVLPVPVSRRGPGSDDCGNDNFVDCGALSRRDVYIPAGGRFLGKFAEIPVTVAFRWAAPGPSVGAVRVSQGVPRVLQVPVSRRGPGSDDSGGVPAATTAGAGNSLGPGTSDNGPPPPPTDPHLRQRTPAPTHLCQRTPTSANGPQCTAGGVPAATTAGAGNSLGPGTSDNGPPPPPTDPHLRQRTPAPTHLCQRTPTSANGPQCTAGGVPAATTAGAGNSLGPGTSDNGPPPPPTDPHLRQRTPAPTHLCQRTPTSANGPQCTGVGALQRGTTGTPGGRGKLRSPVRFYSGGARFPDRNDNFVDCGARSRRDLYIPAGGRFLGKFAEIPVTVAFRWAAPGPWVGAVRVSQGVPRVLPVPVSRRGPGSDDCGCGEQPRPRHLWQRTPTSGNGPLRPHTSANGPLPLPTDPSARAGVGALQRGTTGTPGGRGKLRSPVRFYSGGARFPDRNDNFVDCGARSRRDLYIPAGGRFLGKFAEIPVTVAFRWAAPGPSVGAVRVSQGVPRVLPVPVSRRGPGSDDCGCGEQPRPRHLWQRTPTSGNGPSPLATDPHLRQRTPAPTHLCQRTPTSANGPQCTGARFPDRNDNFVHCGARSRRVLYIPAGGRFLGKFAEIPVTVAFRWAAPGPSVGAVRVSQGVPRALPVPVSRRGPGSDDCGCGEQPRPRHLWQRTPTSGNGPLRPHTSANGPLPLPTDPSARAGVGALQRGTTGTPGGRGKLRSPVRFYSGGARFPDRNDNFVDCGARSRRDLYIPAGGRFLGNFAEIPVTVAFRWAAPGPSVGAVRVSQGVPRVLPVPVSRRGPGSDDCGCGEQPRPRHLWQRTPTSGNGPSPLATDPHLRQRTPAPTHLCQRTPTSANGPQCTGARFPDRNDNFVHCGARSRRVLYIPAGGRFLGKFAEIPVTVAFRWAAPGPSVGAVRVSQGVPRALPVPVSRRGPGSDDCGCGEQPRPRHLWQRTPTSGNGPLRPHTSANGPLPLPTDPSARAGVGALQRGTTGTPGGRGKLRSPVRFYSGGARFPDRNDNFVDCGARSRRDLYIPAGGRFLGNFAEIPVTVAFRWAAPGPSVGAVRVSQGVPRVLPVPVSRRGPGSDDCGCGEQPRPRHLWQRTPTSGNGPSPLATDHHLRQRTPAPTHLCQRTPTSANGPQCTAGGVPAATTAGAGNSLGPGTSGNGPPPLATDPHLWQRTTTSANGPLRPHTSANGPLPLPTDPSAQPAGSRQRRLRVRGTA
ncbi:uncharacterized protein LOC106013432 [Aplysia californica]|uniref:Uncharacterized protein LOC106013432 n=1 Tax=Aplysia californica TaxID=6500 RepID=A0ABM1W276_APLCA|nr:uncharacterized protein LOC106013432 [Aplysia californica]